MQRDAAVEQGEQPSLQIRYVLAMPDYDLADCSPFQGNSFELLSRIHMISGIPKSLPASAGEPFSDALSVVQSRIAGLSAFSIQPLVTPALSALPVSLRHPFWVLLSDEDTFSDVAAFARQARVPPLHVTSAARSDVLRLDDLSFLVVRDYLRKTVEYLHREWPGADLERLRTLVGREVGREEVDLPIERRNHNCTAPNETALESLGFRLQDGQLLISDSDDLYVDAIMRGAWPLTSMRESQREEKLFKRFPPTPSLVVAAPATYKHVQSSRVRPLRGEEFVALRHVREALKFIARQRGYSSSIEASDVRLLEDPGFQHVIATRQQELAAVTFSLATLAASRQSPTLRLPPRVNRVFGKRKMLAECARSTSPNRRRKEQRLASDLMKALAEAVPRKLFPAIDRYGTGIKLVSDAPLEWLPVRGLPLMLRSSVSRITATPGDLCFQLTLPHEQVFLDADAFDDILVLRSFHGDDPLRDTLQFAVSQFFERQPSPARFVDVSSEADVIEALAAYEGPMVVFDCHGSHRSDQDVGHLHLTGGLLESWKLRGRVRVPPIVVLSACDAQALDGSHATTSNGFLSSGAVTVVASMLPIDGLRGAEFVARLLWRVAGLIQPWMRRGGAIRWGDVLTGLQQMMFAHDLIDLTFKHHGRAGDSISALRLKRRATYLIHRDIDWYESLLEQLCKELGATSDAVRGLQQRELALAESMRYVQMGNPDAIVVGSAKTWDVER